MAINDDGELVPPAGIPPMFERIIDGFNIRMYKQFKLACETSQKYLIQAVDQEGSVFEFATSSEPTQGNQKEFLTAVLEQLRHLQMQAAMSQKDSYQECGRYVNN